MTALDPGHGGRDSGARRIHSFHGIEIPYVEKIINLQIVDEICRQFGCRHYWDVTRDGDYFISLVERCSWSNTLSECSKWMKIFPEHRRVRAFISIHCNAVHSFESSNIYGTELWIYPGSKKGGELAESVEKYLKPVVPKWRGIKESGRLYVLKHTAMPAMLIECGFISNKDEAILLSLTDYQQKLAQGIAKGIEEWL